MRKRRLLSVHPVAERGGSDFCLLRMVRMLEAQGWDCHVVTPAASPLADEFRAAGATLHVVPMRRITTTEGIGYWAGYALLWPVAVARLIHLVVKLKPDVVHSNSVHCWYGWAAALLTGRPHVWHAREIVVQSSAALALERFLTRHFCRLLIACSSPVAAQFPSANVKVIPDVIGEEDGLSPERAGRFRARVGIDDGVPLIGVAGRIDTWKGVDVAIDAASRVTDVRPEVQTLIAGAPVPGKEDYAESLRRRAGEMANVHWLGPRSDMADLLADLDLVLVPSTTPEPFASVAVEGLASGVPVVASNAGGSPEMLEQFGPAGGRLVEVGDARDLARGVLEMLPPGPSSVERRRGRRPMIVRQTVTFADALEDVLAGGRC
jgi:glycosyltransferase involved in cell wall biosynthesis